MKKQKTDEAAAAAAGAPAATAATATAAVPAVAGIGAPASVVWAKGTGYGYGANRGAGNVWDPKAAAAAQEAQDEQLCGLLQGLAAALNDEMGGAVDTTDTAAAAAAGQQSSPSAAAAAAESDPMDAGLTPRQQECFAAVQGSVLLPLLVREFGQVAFPEMVSRHQYYQPLLSVLQALCRPATEQLLAANALGAVQQQQQGAGSSSQQQQQPVASIVAALRGLVKGATMYRERMAKTLQGHEKDAAKQAGSSSAPPRVDKQTGEGTQWASLCTGKYAVRCVVGRVECCWRCMQGPLVCVAAMDIVLCACLSFAKGYMQVQRTEIHHTFACAITCADYILLRLVRRVVRLLQRRYWQRQNAAWR
jgi:hypothetical protein